MARSKKPRPSSKKKPTPETNPGKSMVAASVLSRDDAAQTLALAKKIGEFRHKHPSLMARLSLLTIFVELQETLGGEFPSHIAFVHMPDNILNIRRVGRIDIDNMIVGLEVYEMGDIREGILWLPLDYILWVGTTNEPIGKEKIGLESRSASSYSPERSLYEHIRRQLGGLISPDEPPPRAPDAPVQPAPAKPPRGPR